MTVSVLVPYGPGCEWRERAWAWIRKHYENEHPDWELIEGTCEGEWSKGAAVADAFSRSSGDVLVLADADTFVRPEVLTEAVAQLENYAWVVPHSWVYRLREAETERVYAGAIPRRGHVVRRKYLGPPGGGIVVLTRSAYETVNGIDSRYRGWGGEDVSFGWALETLVGPFVRLDGDLYHLFHPHPAPNLRGSPQSEEMVARYKAARFIPRLMRALVDQREPDPPQKLAEPARFSSRPGRKVRLADRVLRFPDGTYETTDGDEADVLRFAYDVQEV